MLREEDRVWLIVYCYCKIKVRVKWYTETESDIDSRNARSNTVAVGFSPICLQFERSSITQVKIKSRNNSTYPYNNYYYFYCSRCQYHQYHDKYPLLPPVPSPVPPLLLAVPPLQLLVPLVLSVHQCVLPYSRGTGARVLSVCESCKREISRYIKHGSYIELY